MVMPLENLRKYRVVLASNSPRRKELLSKLGICFDVETISGISETYPGNMGTAEIPQFISREKAEAYRPTMRPHDLIITADTVVVHKGDVLGKPHSRTEAVKMLESLSEDTHKVITGVTITTVSRQETFAETSLVTFGKLSESEISYYIDTYKPFDKAGSYGIQEWIGLCGIVGIEGDFFNIMGLPVHSLYSRLKDY